MDGKYCSLILSLKSIKSKCKVSVDSKSFLKLSLFDKIYSSRSFNLVCDNVKQKFVFLKCLQNINLLSDFAKLLKEEILKISVFLCVGIKPKLIGHLCLSLLDLMFGQCQKFHTLFIDCCLDNKEFELIINLNTMISFGEEVLIPIKLDDKISSQSCNQCKKRPNFQIKKVDSNLLNRTPGGPPIKSNQQYFSALNKTNKKCSDNCMSIKCNYLKNQSLKQKKRKKKQFMISSPQRSSGMYESDFSSCFNKGNISAIYEDYDDSKSIVISLTDDLTCYSDRADDVKFDDVRFDNVKFDDFRFDSPTSNNVSCVVKNPNECNEILDRCKKASKKSMQNWLEAMKRVSRKSCDPYYKLLHNIYAKEYERANKFNDTF